MNVQPTQGTFWPVHEPKVPTLTEQNYNFTKMISSQKLSVWSISWPPPIWDVCCCHGTDGVPTPNCDGSHWWVFIYPDWVSSVLMDFWIWSYFQTQKHINIYLKKNRVANVICIINRCFMYFHAHIAPHSVDGCSSLWIQKYFSAYF